MIELSIPQAGEETRNSKDLVFSILSLHSSLTTIEITNLIRKKYNASLTYQAIKKAISNLVEKKVLSKEGKRYRINKKWLMDVKITIDKLLTNYEKEKKVHEFRVEFANEQYAAYTITSLIDLDNFWSDLLFYTAAHLGNQKKVWISRTYYSWWMLINLGQETKLFDFMNKKKIVTYVLIARDLPLNRWAQRLYEDKYSKCIVVNDNNLDENESLNVLGDTVIQVKYPKKIIRKLKNFYEKYTNTREMSVKEITQLANEQCEIKLYVFKNKEIAESLRKKYMEKFA